MTLRLVEHSCAADSMFAVLSYKTVLGSRSQIIGDHKFSKYRLLNADIRSLAQQTQGLHTLLCNTAIALRRLQVDRSAMQCAMQADRTSELHYCMLLHHAKIKRMYANQQCRDTVPGMPHMYLMHSASKLGGFAEVICCAGHSLETSCWDQLLIDRGDVGSAASMALCQSRSCIRNHSAEITGTGWLIVLSAS